MNAGLEGSRSPTRDLWVEYTQVRLCLFAAGVASNNVPRPGSVCFTRACDGKAANQVHVLSNDSIRMKGGEKWTKGLVAWR